MTLPSKLKALLICLLLFAAPQYCAAQEQGETFEFESWQELLEFFDGLGYTETAWDEGLREVNRVYLQSMPSRWRGKSSKEVQVKLKKELFLRSLAPLVLRSNEKIMSDRERLMAIGEGSALSDPWLLQLAADYRIGGEEVTTLTPDELAALRQRVDIVPNSLALAQTI